MTILTDETSLGVFWGGLMEALSRERVSISEQAQMYLVFLMVDVIHPGRTRRLIPHDKPLAMTYLQEIEDQQGFVGAEQMRQVGDTALLLCGWWWERAEEQRHGPGVRYYTELGRRAYRLADNDPYEELAEQFRPLTGVLTRMASMTGSFDDGDVVRIYQRWLLTKSATARRVLKQHGIPVDATPQ